MIIPYMLSSLETALRAAGAADDKKAYDIIVLDLREITYITDYFVICSCGSSPQVKAVFDWIDETLARAGERPNHIEGQAEASWVLMDYGSVVVHIFDDQSRIYYSLERLWREAPRVPLPVKSGTS